MSEITCIRCNGKKTSIFNEKIPCQVCNGKGTITEQKRDAILKIRKDLLQRLINSPAYKDTP